MSISIILPWLRLRKVPVRAEVLSSHAVRLYFDYSASVFFVALPWSNMQYSNACGGKLHPNLR